MNFLKLVRKIRSILDVALRDEMYINSFEFCLKIYDFLIPGGSVISNTIGGLFGK